VCQSRSQGFTAEKGTAWARAVQITFRDSPARTKSYVALYGHSESPDAGFYDVRVSAADAGALASLTDAMAGAIPEQIREFAAGLRAAQAAISEPEPEAGA
jgi:hypothetical protein